MSNKKTMVYPYIPNSVPSIKEEMLHAVGAESVEEFYADIPERLRLKRKLDLPDPLLSESELVRHIEGCWRKTAPPVSISASSVLFLAAKMPIQVSAPTGYAFACTFVSPNIMVDPFVAHPNASFNFQSARDLFRAPISSNQIFNQCPYLRTYSFSGFPAPAHRFIVGLFWSISTSSMVSLDLSTNA